MSLTPITQPNATPCILPLSAVVLIRIVFSQGGDPPPDELLLLLLLRAAAVMPPLPLPLPMPPHPQLHVAATLLRGRGGRRLRRLHCDDWGGRRQHRDARLEKSVVAYSRISGLTVGHHGRREQHQGWPFNGRVVVRIHGGGWRG
ncbi:uncharacterized protein PpBr36_06730 [Pyricularia pennisetigena]|uniref:uncharacterized protein n=1 Tax=Pyricularia pennisetigena TaxID=1578925 RepID=UPI001152CC56|nr:uncharacterized protein PpBr36_06730 [Pyricularia pennisetigena]TLS23350.1 hypothetical protein PpBr36_06730 [Pyricularia pennisetigena]